MKTKSIYFGILGLIICFCMAGFLIPVPQITGIIYPIVESMKDPFVLLPAVVFTFMFMGKSNYWYGIIIVGVAISCFIQYYGTKQGFQWDVITLRTLAFISIVYFINVVKLLFGK